MTWIRRVSACLLVCACSAVSAHKDRIIERETDGKLVGLPNQYEPAFLTLRPKAILRIGKNAVTIPQCLVEALSLRQSNLRFTSSWYHDLSILPPYLNIEVIQSESDNGFYNGYGLLFNLDTLKLLQIHRVITAGESQTKKEVSLEAICNNEQLRELTPRVQ